MELHDVYFWTASIEYWRPLLSDDTFKQIIVNSLDYLSQQKKINVYGFVIMPNHIHIIWEMLEMNGKEKPYASFLKFTAHKFQKLLKSKTVYEFKKYNVDESSRKQRYWQHDPLAIKIFSREMLQQKLEYCHNNPLQEHWCLSNEPETYYWSSAYDYCNNFTRFTFLKDYYDRV